MVENLRARLNEKSGIHDLARAMETPFEIDAYDIGLIGSIAYSPELRKFYKETYDPTKRVFRTALERTSVPEALALISTQHALPESEQDARRILGEVARAIMNPELTQEESSIQHDRIYWKENPAPTDIVIARVGTEILDKLFKEIRTFYYEEDLNLYKPSWIQDDDWAVREKGYDCIRPNTVHHFKTEWMNMQGRFEGTIRRS